MTRTATLLLTAALLSPATATAGPDEVVRTLAASFDASALSALHVDFAIGALSIEGTTGDRIEVEVKLECDEDGWRSDRCRDRAEGIEVDARESGERLQLGLDGYRSWGSGGLEVHMTVRVPDRLALSVDMNIGELKIAAMRNDVTVDMSIGEVGLRLPADDVGEVLMDVGIGDSSLRAPDVRRGASGLFVSETSWTEGRGEARIRVDLGIGEIDIRLN